MVLYKLNGIYKDDDVKLNGIKYVNGIQKDDDVKFNGNNR